LLQYVERQLPMLAVVARGYRNPLLPFGAQDFRPCQV
jgi:hypothetical protein